MAFSQLGSCLARMDMSPTMNFMATFHNVKTDYLLHEGVLSAIKCYQKKLGIKWKDDFAVDDASVWKCSLKRWGEGRHARLVKDTDRRA